MASPTLSEKSDGVAVGHRLTIPAWLRNPAGIAIIAALLYGLLGTMTLAREIGQPFAGFMTYGFIVLDRIDLVHETPQWWSGLAPGRLHYGDQLLSINGRPFAANVWRETASAHQRGEGVALEVNRAGESRPVSIRVPVSLFTVQDFLDVKLPELLVGFVFWLLAIMVLRARPDSTTNQAFAVAAACVAIHRLTAVSSLTTDARLLINIPKTGHMLAAGLVGPLLFHLAYLFPRPLARRPTKLLIAVYAAGILCGLTLAVSRLPVWAVLSVQQDLLIGDIAYQTMLYLMLGGLIALFARLFHAWVNRKQETRRERRVVRIVMVGLLLSMPAVVVVLAPIIPQFGVVRTTFLEWLDLRYLLLAIPIAFSYAIIRYQTFQSPSPLFIFVIALALSALLAAIGVFIWGLTQQSGPETAMGRPPFVVFFVFILLASLFWNRQSKLWGWFGRLLHRQDQNYESARAFGDLVMGKNDLSALPHMTAQALVDEFGLERAAVWLWQTETGSYDLAASAGGSGQPPSARLTPPRDPVIQGRALYAARPSTPEWLRKEAEHSRMEVIVPLVAGGRPIGLLGLGRRWDEEIFDERDLAVAELVGQQATLFAVTAAQVEELRRVPARVAEAQERERYRLAGELHDTIQQFLGRLPFYLTVSRDSIETDRPGAAALLDRSIDEVEDAARVLREIRANLAPNQLERSLIKPLESLAAHVERQSGLAVRVGAPEGLDEVTTIGTRHALYRVIQQAIDNTIAHAEATEIDVVLGRENGRVTFAVIDNGLGSTPEKRQTAQGQGSFGLQSMRARVETVGGEFNFDSIEGRGTTVSGWVPAANTSEA